MGRWSGKNTTDDCLKIDIRWLKRQDYLCGFRSGTLTWTYGWDKHKSSVGITVSTTDDYDKYLELSYTQTDRNTEEKKEFNHKIPITTTPCNYGGKRYWFMCPLYKSGVYCGRRVAVLYKSGDWFGCRHCYELAYESNRERYHITSEPELEELEKNIKRTHYDGKMTRKYRSYLKKEKRNSMSLLNLFSKYDDLPKNK